MKQNHYLGQNKTFYFWRTYDGQEIDLIEERENTNAKTGQNLHAYELKWTASRAKSPGAFATNYPDAKYHTINRDNYLNFALGK